MKPSIVDPLIVKYAARVNAHARIERATQKWSVEQLEQLALAIERGAISPLTIATDLEGSSS